MAKAGRPTNFDDRAKRVLQLAYLDGATDAEAAELVGVRVQTITNWKKAHPGFFASIKDWKASADGRVARSLYEKALGGHSVRETRVVKDANGVVVEEVETVKQVPPDTTSMIFWLKNRQPDQWRDKQQTDHNVQVEWVVHTGVVRPDRKDD